MHLLLVGADDLEVVALEDIIHEVQELGHVSQQLRGDALARRVDGDLAPRAREHERGGKHADGDGLAEPGEFLY